MILLAVTLILAWFSLLFIDIPRLCGHVRLNDPDDRLMIALEVVLLASLGGAFKPTALFHWCYLGVLVVWSLLQYRAHWHPLLFGAPVEQVNRYNEQFSRYWYLLPRSRRRIVPDAYHTILHVLLALNLMAVIRELV